MLRGVKKKGLKQAARRVSGPQSIQLFVKLYKRSKVGNRYQLDDPFPKERQPLFNKHYMSKPIRKSTPEL